MSQHVLQAQGFGVAFGDKVILAELNFHIPPAGITVLMGPSGTGKSTLLRSLAGLNQANSRYREWGQLAFQGQPLADGHRPALVVQQPRALSTRVLDYLGEHCRRQDEHLSVAHLRERVAQLLEAFGCADLQPWLQEQTVRLPTELQRCVAILAELAAQPRLLMVDEPTANLSDKAAERVMNLLRRAAAVLPLLVVLHNQRHARALGQHLVLVAGGRVHANHALADFFSHPPNPVAEQFVQTGSCDVASPDAPAETLDAAVLPPPPLPEAAKHTVHLSPPPSLPPVLSAPPAPLERLEPVIPTPAPVAPAVDVPLAMTPAMGVLPHSKLALLSVAPVFEDEYRGPRGFRWVLAGRIGTAPLPGAVLDIDLDLSALRTVGITTLITLTRRDLPQDKLAQHGLRNLHLPIYDREAPSINQLRMLAIRMTRLMQQGEVLCVHCRAGLGRTGTVVAGWLIHEGLTAEAALQRLRAIDKEYVQSIDQEEFLRQLETSFLMKL